ncbi:hypothetical protein MUP77_22540, partial [Candidatus Bathyarchaeota archaeon]|nr:hypothetical protein [Candidatus Bathyarchaeota archaeon]
MSKNYGTSMTTRFGTLVKKNIADDVVALYLRGSAARDDQVIGLSDVDFYMVVRDELLGNVPLRERFYNKLSPLVEYMNQRWANEKLSLRIVPLSYLRTNNVGSFLTGINARLLIGTDVLGKFPQPLSWDISRFGIRELDRFLKYWSNSSYRRKSGNILDEVVYQQEI